MQKKAHTGMCTIVVHESTNLRVQTWPSADLSKGRVLDISRVACWRVGVDEDQLTMVDVKTSLVLLLLNV